MPRWGDIAPRQLSSSHHGGKMTGHKGVVIHTASGYYEGTIDWQMKDLAKMRAAGESPTSSHFVIGKNEGEVAQMLDTDSQSWAQRSGNKDWLSIEFAGFSEPLTDWQMRCCARILVRVHYVYGVPIQNATSPSGSGLGHHSMGYESRVDWGHQFCPGEKIKAQKPAIINLAKQAVATPPAQPVGVPVEDFMQIVTVLNPPAGQKSINGKTLVNHSRGLITPAGFFGLDDNNYGKFHNDTNYWNHSPEFTWQEIQDLCAAWRKVGAGA